MIILSTVFSLEKVEDYLAHFPPERRGAILLGALVSVYGKEDDGSDTAVWLEASEEDLIQIPTSIAHQTIEALQEVNLWMTLL